MSRAVSVGLLSDTHGLLRPEVLAALRGCDLLIHAGDIGREEIMAELARLAPVTAVRGNVDTAPWAQSLPERAVLEVGVSTRLYVVHRIEDLDLDPAVAGFQAVISGHSHKPGMRWQDGVLYVNPGSAGPRRFAHPVCVARLAVEAGRVAAELIEIAPRPG